MLDVDKIEGYCGLCKYSRYDKEQCDFLCSNPDSERYGDGVMYDESCEEWEIK